MSRLYIHRNRERIISYFPSLSFAKRWHDRWIHLTGRAEIDSVISLQTFFRRGKKSGWKRNFLGLRLHRPRVISSRQTMASVAAAEWKKKPRTRRKNSSPPESRGRRPISRLNQLFRRRSSARCYEHTYSFTFVLYTDPRTHVRGHVYPLLSSPPICWRCVCFIGNFRNCVRDA